MSCRERFANGLPRLKVLIVDHYETILPANRSPIVKLRLGEIPRGDLRHSRCKPAPAARNCETGQNGTGIRDWPCRIR